MNKSKIKFNFFMAIIVAISIFILSSIVTIFYPFNAVNTLTNNISVASTSDSDELWDSNAEKFNANVLNNIMNKLFGNQQPKKYIESNYDTQEYNWTQSKVVNARTINQKVGSANNGMLVTLGGKKWIVSSLTLADGDKQDDVILTLYLAESVGTFVFYSPSAVTKGNNAYCKSPLRTNLLTDSNWSLFNKTGENDFATKFLVQPKYIKYQYTQTSIGRGGLHNQNHVPNEALNELTSGWHDKLNGGYNSISEMFGGVRYDAWKDDYIWLPSMTEVGASNNLDTTSIWKLTTSQRNSMGNAKIESWFRTGDVNDYSCANALKTNGERYYYKTDTKLGIRPAIHLNLTEAMTSLVNVDNPQDLEFVFNDKGQTVKSIAEANEASWYDSNIYENANNYIDITYPNNLTELKDADEYWVKLEINQNYINDIHQQVDTEGAKNGWSADYIAKLKAKLQPKFRGMADNTDATHPESDSVRWIKITIQKAEIDFSKVEWSADTLEYNAALQDVTIKSGLPSFLTPKYSDNSEREVNADGTYYTAKVVEFQGEDNNYKTPTAKEIESIPQLQHKWQITKKQIVVSWSSENVTIDDLTLAIPKLKIEANLENSIEYNYYRDLNFTDKVTLEQIFKENDISKKKSYWVTAIFKQSGGDFNSTNCTFIVDGTSTDITDKRFETGDTINKVEVSLADNKLIFNGVEQQVKFNVTGGGLTADALVVTYKTSTGSIMNGLPINVGSYRVAVELKDGYDKYFIVGDSEFEFEITSLKINKPKENQIQFFEPNGFDLSQVANMPNDWENYFEIKVFDKDGNPILPQNGGWKFVNADKYKIQILFKNGVNIGNGGDTDNVIWSDNDTSTYTVNLEIMPLEFVFEGWEDATSNKRPTLIADETEEIEKYFDYVIYEIKNNIIIGNELPQNAKLDYNTNYQINLRVKAEYKGNVYLICNDDKIDETSVYKFKTEINPNPGGGDSSGDGDGDGNGDNSGIGGNNGNNTNSGTDLWFGTNGKLPIFAWILVGVVILLLILIILILVLNRNKQQPPPSQPIPYAQYGQQDKGENANQEIKESKKDSQSFRNVRGTIVNNYKVGYKDWTFVIKETDVLNLETLEYPQDEVMFYAFKKNDLRKVEKLQNQIDSANNEEIENNNNNSSSNDKNNKSKKKKGKKS